MGNIPPNLHAVETNKLLNRKRQCGTVPFLASLSERRAPANRRTKERTNLRKLESRQDGTDNKRRQQNIASFTGCSKCDLVSRRLCSRNAFQAQKFRVKASLVVSISAVDLVDRAVAESKSRVPLEESMQHPRCLSRARCQGPATSISPHRKDTAPAISFVSSAVVL